MTTANANPGRPNCAAFAVQTIFLPSRPGDSQSRNEEMSQPEKQLLCNLIPESDPLPYPLKPLEMATGPAEQVYEIPEKDKDRVFDALYPFISRPGLDDEIYDLHEQRLFRFREAQVIRCRDRNLMVSPYYAHSGGMLVDFMPRETAARKESVSIQKIKE